jgi:hypothetical protein
MHMTENRVSEEFKLLYDGANKAGLPLALTILGAAIKAAGTSMP